MSQRNSEYDRIPGDTYVTPLWVYEALYDVEPWARQAWDCAPVDASFNFLSEQKHRYLGIATNPPFNRAEDFCRHAIAHSERVAMLLPYSFDSAKTRKDLWVNPFKIRYNITTRIRWENLDQKKNGPSQNHAWFVWDWDYIGPAMVGWL